jgi:hypothetical protein
MSSILLPVTADAPHYRFTCSLEGKSYGFELRWNGRSGAWFLTVSDVDGNVLAAGRRVVIGAELLGRSANAALPPGSLFAYDTSNSNRDAGRDDLGGRVKVVYVEAGA